MKFLEKDWHPLIGGIFLALITIYLQFKYYPLDICKGFKLWGDFFLSNLGIKNISLNEHSFFYYSNLNLGIIWGALISSNFSKKFGIKIVSAKEYFYAILGGILMGLGAGLAGGGNISGFYVAMANLSGSAIPMFIGLFLGIYIGVIYQVRVFEKRKKIGATEIRFPKLNLIIGLLFLIVLILTKNIILILGALIGYIFQQSRFCMLNAFREPFILGEAKMSFSLILSLMIAILGISFLKYKGFEDPMLFINSFFGWSALVGGIIFGIGMVLAGGGSIETLWRLGEGDTKFIVVLSFFVFAYYLIVHLMSKYKIILGEKLYLPQYLGYLGTIGILLIILLLWGVVLFWNTKTKKLVKII